MLKVIHRKSFTQLSAKFRSKDPLWRCQVIHRKKSIVSSNSIVTSRDCVDKMHQINVKSKIYTGGQHKRFTSLILWLHLQFCSSPLEYQSMIRVTFAVSSAVLLIVHAINFHLKNDTSIENVHPNIHTATNT